MTFTVFQGARTLVRLVAVVQEKYLNECLSLKSLVMLENFNKEAPKTMCTGKQEYTTSLRRLIVNLLGHVAQIKRANNSNTCQESKRFQKLLVAKWKY